MGRDCSRSAYKSIICAVLCCAFCTSSGCKMGKRCADSSPVASLELDVADHRRVFGRGAATYYDIHLIYLVAVALTILGGPQSRKG